MMALENTTPSLRIGDEEIFVVHFSSMTSEHGFSFPDDMKNVIENPSSFCLSCSAFTRSMLLSAEFNRLAHVGLMIEVSLTREPQTNCCSYGSGNVRAAHNSDLGKFHAQVPCLPNLQTLPENATPSEASLLASMREINSHNEWVMKPPHKIIGIYVDNDSPHVFGAANTVTWIPVTLDHIRSEFQDHPIWIRDSEVGLRNL